MKYLLLCCFEEKRWQEIPDARRDEIMREYRTLMKNLDETGHHLAGNQLQATSTAVTVRSRNGSPAVIDGPFAETKEQLGGYHLMECKDLDEAISIARRIPTIPYGGSVEVRPLVQR